MKKKTKPNTTMTDIQAKINAAGEAYGESFKTGSFFETIRVEAWKACANHILSNPELMREQLLDLITWMDRKRMSITIGGWRCYDNFPQSISNSEVLDLYIEHLKQK